MQPTDLSTIQDVEQAEFEIRHPKTRAGLGIFFMLAGPTHPLRRRGTNEIQQVAMKALAGRADDPAALAAAKEEKDIAWLADCTRGWRQEVRDEQGALVAEQSGPFVTFNGVQLAHSGPVVRGIYADAKYFWLREQVDVMLGKTQDFINDSRASSSPTSSGVTASTGP